MKDLESTLHSIKKSYPISKKHVPSLCGHILKKDGKDGSINLVKFLIIKGI